MNQSTEYAVYLRKSRKDEEAEARGEGETLSRHLTMLTDLARKNGHRFTGVYREIVSGESISGRPEMSRLLQDVAAGRWAGVYCTEIERLARGNTMDQGRVAEAFQLSHTRIITLSKQYDPDNEYDNEYFEFGLFMARREYKAINRRIQAGRKQSVTEGRYIYARTPYGYRRVKIPDGKGYTMAIEEDEAEVVRRVFRQYADTSAGLAVIARQLREEHTPVGLYGKDWTECRLHRMVNNEQYMGMIRDGREKQVKVMEDGQIRKKRITTKEYTLVDGLHPAIIDRETFDACQRKLKAPRPRGNSTTPGFNVRQGIPKNDGKYRANPLAGLIICGECGHVMRRKAACGYQRARLFCRTGGCPTVATYYDDVEQAILSTLRSWMEAAEVGEEAKTGSPINAAKNRLNALRRERAAAEEQLNRLYDLVERGVYTDEMFTVRHATLKSRMTELDGQIVEADRQARPKYATPEQLHDQIKTLLAAYDAADAARKNRMLKQCISKVIYRKEQRGNTINGRVLVDGNHFDLEIYPRINSCND